MRFDQEFTVDAPVGAVWAYLTDVPRMARCIPGASGVTPVDAATYEATVAAKIGPITARFACRVEVLDLDAERHTGAVEISGKDIRLGGGVKARMQMRLEGDGPTRVTIVSDVDVLGKLGQYGHGMIAKRADVMLEAFAACVRGTLAESGA